MNPKRINHNLIRTGPEEVYPPGPFDGKHFFVLHTIPHFDDKFQYVVGLRVEPEAVNDYRAYYNRVRDQTRELANAEKWAAEIHLAAKKRNNEFESPVEVKYHFLNRFEEGREDAHALLDAYTFREPEALLIPSDINVKIGDVLAKKPRCYGLEPGDIDYINRKIQLKGASQQQGMLDTIKTIHKAVSSSR